MTTACLLALMLLTVATAAAQDAAPITASVPASDGSITAEGSSPMAAVSVTALPEKPMPQRAIDKKFIFVMGLLGGAETMRVTSRKLVLDNEFAAGAPWVTHVPENQQLVAKYAGLYASELIVAYEMKKHHSWLPGDRVMRKFWWAYPAAMVAIHIKNGMGNIHTKGPGGCTTAECAMQVP